MTKTNNEKAADELLILRLLTGHAVNKQGREIISYMKHNSLEERKARAALAQQLRDGTLGYIAREALALAVDPSSVSTDSESVNYGRRATRHIRFAGPNKATWVRDLAVVHFIKTYLREHDGSKDKSAIYAAVDHFKMKRATVYNIWKTWLDQVLSRPTK